MKVLPTSIANPLSLAALSRLSDSDLARRVRELRAQSVQLDRGPDRSHNGYHRCKAAYVRARRLLAERGLAACAACDASGVVSLAAGSERVRCDWVHREGARCCKCGDEAYWEMPKYTTAPCPRCRGNGFVVVSHPTDMKARRQLCTRM